MTRRNATSLPGGLLGRQKRKHAPDSQAQDCDPFLSDLQKAIVKEVATLEQLTSAIEEADTDQDQPISDNALGGVHKEESGHASPGTKHEQDAGGPSVGGLGAVQGALACSNLDEEEAALRSHMRRERGRRRKQRKSAFSGFDLSLVNEQIMDFLVDGSSNSLELPDFSKMQRMQVRALAAIYGMEPRACGRRGQTLFKTSSAGLPAAERQAQVKRLLACSFHAGKPSQAARFEMDSALRAGRASLRQPIAATNKGSILLKQMGWSEGYGLGVKEQGRTEPIPLHLGQRRRGLGS